MAAPTRANIKYRPGADGNPGNDTSPVGGAIDTGTEYDPNNAGNLYSGISIGSSDKTVYSIHYRRQEGSGGGSMQNARFYNRAGAKVNTGAGSATITSNKSTEDIQIRVVGKVSGAWDTEVLTVSGTTPAVGSKVWDAGSVRRWESVDGSTPVGLLTCAVNGETVGIIYGTSADPQDGDPESLSCYMISAEVTWALATAINTNLNSSNRITAPTGIGSFEEALWWSSNDAAISVPGATLTDDDYIGVVGKLQILGDIPQPLHDFLIKGVILGDSQA